MNFIADSPEDVNGWVEGMELHVLRFSETCSVAPVSLLVKLALSSSHLHSRPALPICKVQSLYLQRVKLKGSGNIFTFFFLVAIKDLFSMVYRK